MVIRKYSPFPITSMRNMIDGAGKFNSQFFNHDKRVSESKNTHQSLFSIIRFDPDAIKSKNTHQSLFSIIRFDPDAISFAGTGESLDQRGASSLHIGSTQTVAESVSLIKTILLNVIGGNRINMTQKKH
jgi:hypothetical protein